MSRITWIAFAAWIGAACARRGCEENEPDVDEAELQTAIGCVATESCEDVEDVAAAVSAAKGD